MYDFEKFILLMSLAVLLVSIAKKFSIPYPIALVIGGGLLSTVPGLDFTYFDPNLILTIVLPPILYHGAFWTSVTEFKRNITRICSLAFGLVLTTTLIVGLFFKWCFPDYSWALAFAFGAIVSPPDATSAISILKRFPIGNRLTAILEGESLVNDACALILFKVAVAAILTGTFSLADAGIDFLYMAAGGIFLGVLFGYGLQLFSKRFFDATVGVFSSLLLPYIVYIAATLLNLSSVLAVIASGTVASRMIFRHQTALRRILGHITWDMYIMLLNCFIFILIGSQLDEQTRDISWQNVFTYTSYALLVTILTIGIRFLWTALDSVISYYRSPNQLAAIVKDGVIISWMGMRGIVSLTAALALPLSLQDGSPLAGRQEAIYMAFCVILFTLIIPGLTLPTLISWLHMPKEPHNFASLETRQKLAKVASEEITHLNLTHDEESLLHDYFHTRFRFWESVTEESGNKPHLESARKKVISAQRTVLLEIWENGHIDDKLLAELEHELDSEETQTARVDMT